MQRLLVFLVTNASNGVNAVGFPYLPKKKSRAGHAPWITVMSDIIGCYKQLQSMGAHSWKNKHDVWVGQLWTYSWFVEHHSLPLICAFLSVCCFSYKSSRLAGNEEKLTIPLRNGDERKCGLEMWGGPTPLSIMPQTWTLWPLPVPNLIPPYEPEQSGPGLSLRMTGKTQPTEKSVCIATRRRCKNKLAQTPHRSARNVRRKATWQCTHL